MTSAPVNTELYEPNIVVTIIAKIKIAIRISIRVKPLSGCWLPVAGYRMLDTGCWFLVPGSWFLVPGCRLPDAE